MEHHTEILTDIMPVAGKQLAGRQLTAAAVRWFKTRAFVPTLLALACLLAALPATAQVNYTVAGGTAYVARSPGSSGDVVIASTYNGFPVTGIGPFAFEGCAGLTSVTIPNSVTSIGFAPFNGCTSLTNFSVEAAHPVYTSLDGVLFDKAETTLLMFPPGCGSYVIPDSVTRIGAGLYAGSPGAFFYCAGLTNVILGPGVTNIGYAAFAYCSNLTRVTIPASVINLGSSAFRDCSRLTNLTFLGHAPTRIFDLNAGFAQFQNVGAGAKAYYYCGTTGWGATYGPLPTVMLCPPQIAPGGAGVKPCGFGFTLNRLTNQTVIEASADLVDWQPIWTNTLPGTSADFFDPEWLNHSNRFYRARPE